MLEYLATIKKALMPVLVGGVITALGWIGITSEMTVEQAVTLAVTAVLTWFVKNKE